MLKDQCLNQKGATIAKQDIARTVRVIELHFWTTLYCCGQLKSLIVLEI